MNKSSIFTPVRGSTEELQQTVPAQNSIPHSTHRPIKPSVLYFGTPVAVVSSMNTDGTTNLAPISSYWALDNLLVLGLGSDSHTLANLKLHPELVLNLADETSWQKMEQLGDTTGADPVPPSKRKGTHFVADKFEVVGWHPIQADTVTPHRVVELPVHLEAKVTSIHDEAGGLSVVHARCTQVHAADELTIDRTSHINPGLWRPLIYNFRHYFGLGNRLGLASHAEVR
ncbi:flavin reductase family protein [Leucobacter coleopterorum]|uniref:Flavin reductase family protein n=1 Tax=Leucobacter coleopterorum TaxID=2714933 RepID=A0ABX6JU71_9MICO|nr:flavin reductase family protein [Leucobacter coleopterorum]QIM17841.1 flavin reductase family protein [Leucobacter coleopterorum]